MNPESVGTESSAYKGLLDELTLVNCMYNLYATHNDDKLKGHSIFVQKGAKEPKDIYDARLHHAWCTNYLGEVIPAQVGAILKEYEIDFSEFTDPTLISWLKNITGTGISLEGVVSQLLHNALLYGYAPWYINYPTYDKGAVHTLRDLQDLNMQPTVVVMDPLSMIEATSMTVNGIIQPARVKFKITQSSSYNPLTGELEDDESTYDAVLVLTSEGIDLYYKNKKNKYEQSGATSPWVKTDDKSTSCTPLTYAVTSEPGAFMYSPPPYAELAQTQAKLYESVGTHDYSVSQACIMILFGKQISKNSNSVDVGAVTLVTADSPTADLRFIEIGGAALTISNVKLERLKAECEALSGITFSGDTANSTATKEVMLSASAANMRQSLVISVAYNLTMILRSLALRGGLKLSNPAAEVHLLKKDATTFVTDATQSTDPNTTVGAFVNNTKKLTGAHS